MSTSSYHTDLKTLTDLINHSDRYDINKITFYTVTDDGTLVIQDSSLFDMYYRFVIPYVGTYQVTQAQRDYYRCRPALLSLDVYGTSSLAWMILKLNDKECPSKFYMKETIRLIPSSRIAEVYDAIATKSSDRIEANRRKYLRMVGEQVGES